MEYTRIIPIPSTTCEIPAKEGKGLCGKPADWLVIDNEGIRMAMCANCLSDLLADDLGTREWAIGLDAITVTEGDC